MNKVAKIAQLGKYVNYFTGKDLSASIKAAEIWASRNGITLSNFYLQVSNNRAIIVDYIKADEILI